MGAARGGCSTTNESIFVNLYDQGCMKVDQSRDLHGVMSHQVKTVDGKDIEQSVNLLQGKSTCHTDGRVTRDCGLQ